MHRMLPEIRQLHDQHPFRRLAHYTVIFFEGNGFFGKVVFCRTQFSLGVLLALTKQAFILKPDDTFSCLAFPSSIVTDRSLRSSPIPQTLVKTDQFGFRIRYSHYFAQNAATLIREVLDGLGLGTAALLRFLRLSVTIFRSRLPLYARAMRICFVLSAIQLALLAARLAFHRARLSDFS
jgi:hypothetical protein